MGWRDGTSTGRVGWFARYHPQGLPEYVTMSSYSVQEVSRKWSQVALRWKTLHLGLSNLKQITLYTSQSTSWLLVLYSSHLNVQQNESSRFAPCFRPLRFHWGSKISPFRTPSVRLRIYPQTAVALPRRWEYWVVYMEKGEAHTEIGATGW